MYANLITFLAVILLFELFPYAPKGEQMAPGEVLAAIGGTIVLFFFLTWRGFVRWERRGRGRELDPEAFPFFHASLVQRYVFAAVVVYGLLLYLFRWKIFCVGLLGQDGSQFLTSLVGILPFLLLLLSVWTASYPTRGAWNRPVISLASHLSSQARLFMPVLFPWLGILLVMDLLGVLSPQLQRRVAEDPLWGLVTFAVLLLILAWIFPSLVVRLWRCPPLPPGPHRERLEAFFERHSFRYAQVVLWTLFEGSLSTAGILGVFTRSRYILITPSLLRMLDEDELEAVMAHEMGHARYHHMAFYLAFMVGLTLLIDLALRGVPWLLTLALVALDEAGVPAAGWLGGLEMESTTLYLIPTILVLLLLVVLYLRYGFGVFSRNFERQSDLHALDIQGTSESIVRSLEKISGFHPLIRVLPNWHHFSIQERIDFLLACEEQPERIRGHHRKVRRMVVGYLVGLAALGAVVVVGSAMHWDRAAQLALGDRIAERILLSQPGNAALWSYIGGRAFERGDLVKAEDALAQALRLDPGNPDALNNLAWLYAKAPSGPFRRPEAALRLAETAARLRPNVPEILDTLAEACFVNGRFAKALETEKRALELARDRQDHYRNQVKRFQEALSRHP